MVECADGLFDGGVAVRAVGVDEIEVFEVEALETAIDAFDDVFARETVVVYWVVTVCRSPVDLIIVRRVITM